MSLAEFEDVVYKAAFLESEDPVAAWKSFGDRLERAASFLETTSELRLVAEDTDLTLGWTGGRGSEPTARRTCRMERCSRARSSRAPKGRSRFSFPATMRGRQVEDVRLRFEGGEVVEATPHAVRTSCAS